MRGRATLFASAVFAVALTSVSYAQLPADNIIMRVRHICNGGQGGALTAAVDFRPRTNMWPGAEGRIGGFAITFTYTSSKLVLNGVSPRYEQGYWGNPYRSQSFGPSAWFNQHANTGNPGQALPVTSSYFEPSTNCAGNPLNDGFFELMRYSMTIGATVNGTVDLGLYDVQPYNTSPYQQNVQMSAIFSPDITTNLNDSTLMTIGLLVPVELAAFNATARPDGSIMLTWHTASEAMNRGFEVQRGDGATFQPIGFLDGHGTTTEPHDYTFVDRTPSDAARDGLVFYRLKQIDTDGTESFSEIVSEQVLPGAVALGQNYPNPVSAGTSTTIPYTLAVPATVSLAVYNTMGERVATLVDTQSRQGGRHSAEWNLRSDDGAMLPSGTYFVRFSARMGSEEMSFNRQVSIIR